MLAANVATNPLKGRGGDSYSRGERFTRLPKCSIFPLQSSFRRATTCFILTACGSETSLTPLRGCHDKLVCASVVFPPFPPEHSSPQAAPPPAGTTRRSVGPGDHHGHQFRGHNCP